MQRTPKIFLTVAILQMQITGNKQQNLHHAVQLITKATRQFHPQLVVLPEFFNTKFGKPFFDDAAETIPTGETITTLSRLAKELHIYLVCGSIPEKEDAHIFNTTVVFDANGNLIESYRQMHLFDIPLDNYRLQEQRYFTAGNELKMFELNGIKIGLAVGYDMAFAKHARLYREHGAEVLICPSSYPEFLGAEQWTHVIRGQATENRMYVVAVNQARSSIEADYQRCEYNQIGQSMVVDFEGNVLSHAGEGEEMGFATLNIDELRQFREVKHLQ